MNGKAAKKLRRRAMWQATSILSGLEGVAPWAVVGLPAHALVRDLETGVIRIPAETGRFYYQRLKAAYNAYMRAGTTQLQRLTAWNESVAQHSDLASKLRKRVVLARKKLADDEQRAAAKRVEEALS